MSNFNPSNYLNEIINSNLEANIDNEILVKFLKKLANKIEKHRGVYAVLITLCLYKIENPDQDIRYHKKDLENGFSGRTYDTKFVTPILKKNGLPSMAESGWLTRSLEQQHPYNLKFPGKISGTEVKESFLNIINIFQKKPEYCRDILIYLINEGKKIKEKNFIDIIKINKENSYTIQEIIVCLKLFIFKEYNASGGSKIPVICIYTLMELICGEVERYKDSVMKPLGFHTTSDKTSKSAGDIEIFKSNKCYEAFEIKLEHAVNDHMIRIAYDKIKAFNPQRYFILTTANVDEKLYGENKLIKEVRKQHGCEIIVKNFFDVFEKYIILLKDLNLFTNLFTQNILADKELKIIHKNYWKKILEEKLVCQ